MYIELTIKHPKTNHLGKQLKDKAELSGKKLIGVIEGFNFITYKYKSL